MLAAAHLQVPHLWWLLTALIPTAACLALTIAGVMETTIRQRRADGSHLLPQKGHALGDLRFAQAV